MRHFLSNKNFLLHRVLHFWGSNQNFPTSPYPLSVPYPIPEPYPVPVPYPFPLVPALPRPEPEWSWRGKKAQDFPDQNRNSSNHIQRSRYFIGKVSWDFKFFTLFPVFFTMSPGYYSSRSVFAFFLSFSFKYILILKYRIISYKKEAIIFVKHSLYPICFLNC